MRSRINNIIQNPTFNTIGILICFMHVVSWYIIFHNNHFRKDLIEHNKVGALAAFFLALSHGIVVLLLSAKASKTGLFRFLVYASFLVTLSGAVFKVIAGFNLQNLIPGSGNTMVIFGSLFFNLFLILDTFTSERKLTYYGGLSLVVIILYPVVMTFSEGFINYERLLFMLPSIYLIYILLSFRKPRLKDESDILDQHV